MKTEDLLPDSLLTSYQVGSLLQVNPSSINKWVKDGRIQAFRTPGGHRRIRAGDLVNFLSTHKMPIPRSLASASKRRLLVVDDEQRQLDALRRLLKAHSDRVEVSLLTNGIEALVQIGSFKPHVAILDVYMPSVDGLEVCRHLKNNPETKAIKIIVTSGQITPEIEQKARLAGADMCIQKPLDLPLILAELETSAQLLFAANA